jgi:integrase
VEKFPGFDDALDPKVFTKVVQIPERIYSLDGKRLVPVNLVCMPVPSDAQGTTNFRFDEKLSSFSAMTRRSAEYVLLEALNGKRKTSTCIRWLSELSLFSRTVSESMGAQINVITLKMYLWYTSQKNASQEKLLRGVLLRWMREEAPGIKAELATHLRTTAPRKPRGMIEVQNAVPGERPFSMEQVQGLLKDIDDLYLSREFTPQDNLLWRLMISEALRPAQMSLLQIHDIKIDRDANERLLAVRMNVPLVKQAGVPARDYMREHRLSLSLSQAVVDHLEFAESVHGGPLPRTWAVFGVRLAAGNKKLISQRKSIGMQHLIGRTKSKISSRNDALEDTDLFNRRFKHTKLTHLAAAGAPLEVLAYAGFQTSTISLSRYVNLTEEAFAGYEAKLESTYQHIENAFRGNVIERSEATHPDTEHRIAAPTMDDDVGSCSAEPCEVLACLGCYGCPRFEAFKDGPHDRVEAMLVAEQERARAAGMPSETIHLRSPTLAAVRRVIQIVNG